jgi:hypothetical protein
MEIILFVWGKTYNGAFLGVFQGGRYLFDPKVSLPYAQDNLGVKKPAKRFIVCFACEKNFPDFPNQRYINS